MVKIFRHTKNDLEAGQIAILLAVSMVGLVAIVGLAIDGGMLFWNQRRAQNAADAAALSGTTALVDLVMDETFACGVTPSQPILDKVWQYTANNDVPDSAGGNNVNAYYLTTNVDGDWVDLTDSVGNPWEIGVTSTTVPCEDIVGVHVVTSFPQDTFLAGVIGFAETNLIVDASAIYKQENWCTGFLIFGASTSRKSGVVSITGAYTKLIGGGAHSNGGMQISGGGQGIYLEDGAPIEYGEGGDTSFNCGKIVGGPEGNDGTCDGFEETHPYAPPEFYAFEDFAPIPAPAGFLYLEAVKSPGANVVYTAADITDATVHNATTGQLIDGLYITEGDIILNDVDIDDDEKPWQATLIAKGEIKISGSLKQVPYFRGIFAVSYSSDTNNGAIQLSGSDNSWAGLVVAPNGLVNFSGARNSELGGQILGFEVDFSGSNNALVYHSSFCPANYPTVMLVE